ncbi:MAG: hypothetical protein ACRESK_06675, partial [Gammaproteobacteria bacterium]
MLKQSIKLVLMSLMLVAAHAGHTQVTHTDRMNLSCVQDLNDRELKCDYRLYSGEAVTGIAAVTGGTTLAVKHAENYPWD